MSYRIPKFNYAVSAVGFILIVVSVITITPNLIHYAEILLAAGIVVIVQRFSFEIPRSDLSLTFGDAVTYATFLFFGWQEAILVAAVDAFWSSYKLRAKGIDVRTSAIAFNVSSFDDPFYRFSLSADRLNVDRYLPPQEPPAADSAGADSLVGEYPGRVVRWQTLVEEFDAGI